MHIAYSALRTTTKKGRLKEHDPALQQRYEAYQAVCRKHEAEIAAIRQYLPGWVPPFDIDTPVTGAK